MPSHTRQRRGLSLVGLLVTMVLILILGMVLLNSLNVATTGAGNTLPGTVASVRDEINLSRLFESILAWSNDRGGRFIVPSEVDRSLDHSADTTANLFSAMIAQRYTEPRNLISENERNPWVVEDWDYNYASWNPAANKYWDPHFQGDLERGSNVSFAHMPLIGDREKNHWLHSRMDMTFPVMGTRGPKDGVDNPQSQTYGRDGKWGGHLAYGDGHVRFVDTFKLSTGDNVFAMEQGPGGEDAIISFTKSISSRSVELQFD